MAKKGKKKKQERDLLKLIGIKSEKKVNKIVRKWLDDPTVIDLVKLGAKQHVRLLKLVREYVDVLALQLNIPTKADVASVAKLAHNIEEKLDCLEDKMVGLCHEKSNEVRNIKETKRKRIEKKKLREMLLKNLNTLHSNDLNEELKQMLESRLKRRE